MIKFENVAFKYSGTDFLILENVNLTIPAGELVLVVGKTRSGKSTLLGLLNGLVPNFTGGDLTGDVTGDVTGNLTGDVTGTVSAISNHNTDALSEGSTNLYFTDNNSTY